MPSAPRCSAWRRLTTSSVSAEARVFAAAAARSRGGGGGGRRQPAVRARQRARWRDTKHTSLTNKQTHSDPAEVLESKPDASSTKKGGGALVYYVHFLDCDKRLDEWVTADRMSLPAPQSGANKLEAAPSLALQAG